MLLTPSSASLKRVLRHDCRPGAGPVDTAGDGDAITARPLEGERESGVAVTPSDRSSEKRRERRAGEFGGEPALQTIVARARRRASLDRANAGNTARIH